MAARVHAARSEERTSYLTQLKELVERHRAEAAAEPSAAAAATALAALAEELSQPSAAARPPFVLPSSVSRPNLRAPFPPEGHSRRAAASTHLSGSHSEEALPLRPPASLLSAHRTGDSVSRQHLLKLHH